MSSTALPQLNAPRPVPAAIRHEMLFFNVFRLVQALVYIGLAFAPSKIGGVSAGSLQFALVVTLPYLLFAVAALSLTRRCVPYAKAAVSVWLVVDIIVSVLAISAIGYARIGIAMMLAVNLAAGALILSLRVSSFFAALATLGLLGHALLAAPDNLQGDRDLLESALFGVAYFAITAL
ncbi:MAG: two-component sensor histidine kinase, partial [Xanthomonadaceae bacterium]|nr:two-component sensor histidine kinase [Xanthomonadaceae bacterium]